MSVEGTAIVVPALGESIVEARILNWLRKEGEKVAAGDPVVELETDKVNVEVPAEADGVLVRIDRKEGDTVAVGETLGVLSGASNGAAPVAAPVQEASAVPAPDYGKEQPAAQEAATAPAAPVAEQGNGHHATPVAQRMATERNLDLSKVKGTGPGGKITKEDVANFSEPPAALLAAPVAVEPAVKPAPPIAAPPSVPAADKQSALTELGFSDTRREERVRMSMKQKTAARRLVEAQHNAAMLTTFNEVDLTAVMEVRKRRKDSFKEKHGVNLGFMSFFTKAVIGALKAFPYLNAEIQGEEIVVKRYYDIGIAVSTNDGLLVPVLRDADRKSFAEIEKGIADLAGRVRENKITLPELLGGTFTITNGGVFGSLMSTPILNAPQVGILGMHKIEERPVVRDGQIVIRPMMYVALSYDHRIVNGSESVRFLVRVKELLEDPESLLLEG